MSKSSPTAHMDSSQRTNYLLTMCEEGKKDEAIALLWEWIRKDKIEFRHFSWLLTVVTADCGEESALRASKVFG